MDGNAGSPPDRAVGDRTEAHAVARVRRLTRVGVGLDVCAENTGGWNVQRRRAL